MIGEKKKGLVESKYYCQVENDEVKIAMELSAPAQAQAKRLPLRYTLVIDVSGSMGEVGKDQMTRLNRVKIFTQLAVQTISKQDFLSIITFATEARTDLEMTQMDDIGKDKGKKVLRSLCTRDQTNLEAGLCQGVREIGRASAGPSSPEKTRDCIILFTDGEANHGIIDPTELVEKYKHLQKEMKRKSCIPLSAFTIGNYKPELLLQIASELGSEAFYWLDESKHYEGDILIPLLLREMTRTSDLKIRMSVENGVSFRRDRIFKEHLDALVEDQATELRYFIHSLPRDIVKTIPIHLFLPKGQSQGLRGETILEIEFTYLDDELELQKVNDTVILTGRTLDESRKSEKVPPPSNSFQILSKEIITFIMVDNESTYGWLDAKRVLSKIATEDCKRLGAEVVDLAKDASPNRSYDELDRVKNENLRAIEEAKKRMVDLLGAECDETKKVLEETKQLETHVALARKIAEDPSDEGFCRIAAIQSAMVKQMPATTIFDGLLQPFRPVSIDETLNTAAEIIGEAKDAGQENFDEILTALSDKQKAIEKARAEAEAEQEEIRKRREAEREEERMKINKMAEIDAQKKAIEQTRAKVEAEQEEKRKKRQQEAEREEEMRKKKMPEIEAWKYTDVAFVVMCFAFFAYSITFPTMSGTVIGFLLIGCLALHEFSAIIALTIARTLFFIYVLSFFVPLGALLAALPFLAFVTGNLVMVLEHCDAIRYAIYLAGSFVFGAVVVILWVAQWCVLSFLIVLAWMASAVTWIKNSERKTADRSVLATFSYMYDTARSVSDLL